ncbi:TraR/DksA C4-type zinc finger protein [Methylomarinum sp. Ch1-1]|uniref:TraR/DksA C4-type zinc finger protein n=1 Tax=Methylomarinum roseum TaxID=3067653 RepID=A0AAU7NY28_9GAMM|nr:TraR/DksA C4-type zinc finger protein [Methylomarinum sp. Ch1-1]MDP4522024.1 hypothetical protein [Methylomarinum sp. Ch1-1]
MNDQQRLKLKRLIRARIALLEEVLGDIGTITSRKHPEEVESAHLDISDSSVESEIVGNTERELTRLKLNLQWLDSEEGGACERCGGEISYARLETAPDTWLCAACTEPKGE